MQRIKIGVIGCGMVAQVMHLPYLTELSDRYELAALCDLSARLVQHLDERYQVERRYTDYERMLDEVDLDAVLVLTSPTSSRPWPRSGEGSTSSSRSRCATPCARPTLWSRRLRRPGPP